MPLLPSKTTAISDAVLAASCIWGLYSLQGSPSNHLAKIWFVLTLVASAIGGIRFCKWPVSAAPIWQVEKEVLWHTSILSSGIEDRTFAIDTAELRRDYFDRLAPIHDLLSWLVLVVGLPCLSAQFYQNSDLFALGNLHLLLLLPPVFSWLGKNRMLGTAISRTETNRVTGYMALFCMLSLTGHAVYTRNFNQLLACLLMIFSSRTFNMTEARKLGLPPVDWLHYGLAASNVLLTAALGHANVPGVEKLRLWTGRAIGSMFS